MIQRILAHRYELLEHVGGGGMADVYRAHDKLLDRAVAVKVLHAQFSNDEEFIEKFHREAQGAARLSHPNIVNIYDVGKEGDSHYIVMEYVAGETLKSKIQREGHLSVEEALDIAEEIAEALEHAHTNNLVHCDIKPHNILMMPNGRVKVADFGIARAITSSTMTYSGTVVGSVHYFSPEQAKGSIITPKSDIYSLGVVLYEMLTGKLPFTGETPVGIALKHLQEEPVSIRKVNPEIPPIVEAVVRKAMMKNSEERPNSTEIVQDIRQAKACLYQNSNNNNIRDPFATQVLPRIQDEELLPARRTDSDFPEEKTSVFKSKKFVASLVVILIMGFVVGAFFSYGKFWSTAEVVVPDVVGRQMNIAKQVLEDSHLRVKLAETYDANVPAGQVVSQYPEAGSKVKEERLVTIYISKGGEEIDMPDLIGMSKVVAEEKLKNIGLSLGQVTEQYASEEAGTVINQYPRSGSKITKGKTVDIVISKGAKVQKVRMPDFTGRTLESVKENLSSLNLSVGTVTKRISRQPTGTIIEQSPAANSEVTEGTSVDLIIAEQEKATEKNTGKTSNGKDSNVKDPNKQMDAAKSAK
jgi:serine/threonine-protein kinase